MKDLIKRVIPFITFDFPLQAEYIKAQFAITHSKHQVDMPEWSTTATRQKMISRYWYVHVLIHFTVIFGLALIGCLFYNCLSQPKFYLLGLFISIMVGYPILYLFHYRPHFNSTFLPRLETVKEIYEFKQKEHFEKCRKAQLRNPTLILIHYVLDKTSGMNAIEGNDKFTNLLMKLYGVDPGSLKNNINMLLGSSINKSGLKARGQTEISNRFSEARDFFHELNFLKGIEILDKLEARFFI